MRRLVVVIVVGVGGDVGMGGGVGWWGGVVIWAGEAVVGGHVGSKKELRASWSAAEPSNCVQDAVGCVVEDLTVDADAVLEEFV